MNTMKNEAKKISILLGTLALVGCASGPSMRVDEKLLTDLPPGQMQGVIRARAEHDMAVDAFKKAQADALAAAAQVKVVKTELELAKSEVEHAKAKAEIAKNGSELDYQRAQDETTLREAMVAQKRSLLTLRTRQQEYAESAAGLAEVRQELSEARVEAAKARAVQGIDKAAVREISISRFDLQVSEYKSNVADAEQSLAGVGVEVEEAQHSYESASARVEALRGTPAPAPQQAEAMQAPQAPMPAPQAPMPAPESNSGY